jgi:hypothetical protein
MFLDFPDGSEVPLFDAGAPPDLGHTRVLSAAFDGQSASKWNALVVVAHRQALTRLKSFDALRTGGARRKTATLSG